MAFPTSPPEHSKSGDVNSLRHSPGTPRRGGPNGSLAAMASMWALRQRLRLGNALPPLQSQPWASRLLPRPAGGGPLAPLPQPPPTTRPWASRLRPRPAPSCRTAPLPPRPSPTAPRCADPWLSGSARRAPGLLPPKPAPTRTIPWAPPPSLPETALLRIRRHMLRRRLHPSLPPTCPRLLTLCRCASTRSALLNC